MFQYIFLLVSLLGNYMTDVSASNTCGNSPYISFYVNNNYELNNLKDCSVVNGSIFINGGYNIESLEPLKQITHITGNLVIIDSHILDSLKGLHNLNQIDGDNLYLNQYSLVIKDNINNHNDNYYGLCYSNNVNWDNITDKSILILDNNDSCVCHPECDGCFGPGPKLCQQCRHYNSGGACVPECPLGSTSTSTIPPFCIETIPSNPGLTLISKTKNSITLQLIAPNNPGGFITEYDLMMDGQSIYKQSYNDDGYHYSNYYYSYTQSNLNSYTNYSFDLLVKNQIGENNLSTPFIVETLPGPPSKPENVNIIVDGSTQVSINWHKPQQENGLITQYEYYLESSNALTKFNITNLADYPYSYTITGLNPYTSYDIKIRAYVGNYLGNFSDLVTFTTLEDLPSFPTNLLVNNISHESCNLNWQEPNPSNGLITNYQYSVYSNNNLYLNGYTDQTSIFLDTLEPFTDYEFEVKAFTSVGSGNFSEKTSFKTHEWYPSLPRNIVASNITNTSVEVSYHPPLSPNGDIYRYNYRVNYDNIYGTYESDGFTENLDFTIDGLLPFTSYNISVNSCNNLYCSQFSDNIEFITDEGIPSKPINLLYTNLDSTSVDINWDIPNQPNGIITHYEYIMDYTILCNNSQHTISGSSTNNFISFNTLHPYTSYNFIIKACSIKGCSHNSDSLSFQTTSQIPDKMLITSLETIDNTSLKLTFDNNNLECHGKINNYEVKLEDSNNNIQELTYPSNGITNFITINNLTPFMEYSVAIRSYTSAGTTVYSNYLNTQLPPGIPPKPDIPFVFNDSVTNNSLTLTINQVLNTTGIIKNYRVYVYNFNSTIVVYDGVYLSTIEVNNLLTDIEYWFKLEVCNTVNLCSSSDSSIKITLGDNNHGNQNGSEKSDSSEGLSDEAKYWIIGSTLGLLLLVILVLISVKLVKNHKEKKNALASAVRPVTPSNRRSRTNETSFNNDSYQDVVHPISTPDIESNRTTSVRNNIIDDTSSTDSCIESYNDLNKPVTKVTTFESLKYASSAINENDMDLESVYEE